MTTRMETLKAENAQLKNDNYELLMELHDIELQKGFAAEHLPAAIDKLKAENAELKAEITGLTSENSAILTEAKDTIEKYEKVTSKVWTKNTILKGEIETLEKKVKRQQEQITAQRKDVLRLRKYDPLLSRCCVKCDYAYMNSDYCLQCL